MGWVSAGVSASGVSGDEQAGPGASDITTKTAILNEFWILDSSPIFFTNLRIQAESHDGMEGSVPPEKILKYSKCIISSG